MDNESEFKRLARDLSNEPFSTALSEEEHRLATGLLQSGATKRLYRLGSRWLVKLYAGGQQRNWASTLNGISACRISDLLLVRSRDRQKKSVSDDDLNLSVCRARSDIDSEGQIISIVVQMETLLPDSSPRVSRKGSANRTVREEFLKAQETLLFRLDDIKKVLDVLADRLLALENWKPFTVTLPTPQQFITPLHPSTIGDPVPANPISWCGDTGTTPGNAT